MAGKKNIFVGTGISRDDDPFEAGKEAASMAVTRSGAKPNLAVVFCSGKKYGKDDASIKRFVEGADSVLSGCKWFGCTTAGEISDYGVTFDSAVALALSSEFINAGIGIGGGVSRNAQKAGKDAAENAMKDLSYDKYLAPYVQFQAMKNKGARELMNLQPYSTILIAPGSTMKYLGLESDILEGVMEVVGGHIPIIGGSAGDDFAFRQTYQFANGKVHKDSAIVVSFVNDLMSGFGVAHGYKPTNAIVMVTKSEGKVVKELNKRPALRVYSELVGIPIEELQGPKPAWIGVQHPFGVADTTGKYWIKAPQAGNGTDLIFFSKIPKHMMMAMMEPDMDQSINAIKGALKDPHNIKDLACSIIFDCGSRRTYLGDKVTKEADVIKKSLGKTPYIGFYTYGEFSFSYKTTATLSNCSFVNFSIGNKLISE